MEHELIKSIAQLVGKLTELIEEQKREFEWAKSHSTCVTKTDLDATEKRILDAISSSQGVDPSLKQAFANMAALLQQHSTALSAAVQAAKKS